MLRDKARPLEVFNVECASSHYMLRFSSLCLSRLVTDLKVNA